MIYNSKVIDNKRIGVNFYYLKLSIDKKFVPLPGQFINILIDNSYEIFLRRPFSIFDIKKGCLELIYKIVGKGTETLSKKKKGDSVNFLGPLGNSYINFVTDRRNFLKNILLVAGGTGIASLYFLCKWLHNKKIDFTLIYGAKTKKEIILVNSLKKFNTIFITDDGSYGEKGSVIDLIKKHINTDTVIFACGPTPMLKSIKNLKLKNDIYASFESYMGCGFGTCLSCVIPVKDNNGYDYKRVCNDGPVFDLNNVIFEE